MCYRRGEGMRTFSIIGPARATGEEGAHIYLIHRYCTCYRKGGSCVC